MLILRILAIIGFLVSIYAYSVEKKVKKDKKHKAICDIKDNISCSKAFSSKYSKLTGISNALGGIFFYILFFILTFYSLKLVFYLSVLAFLGSIYLAYISYFRLKNYCLVCMSVYIINTLLLVFSYLEVY